VSGESEGKFRDDLAWESSEIDLILSFFRTDHEKGLTAEEAKSRLARYGPNELATGKRVSSLRLLAKQFVNVLLFLLLIASAISAFLGEWIDTIVIVVIIAFVVILGFVQEHKAEKSLEALKRILSPTCTVIRGGSENDIPIKEIVPGDIVILESGDKVSADMRLIESINMQTDEAPLTGESSPVAKVSRALPTHTSQLERINMVFFGTTVTYGKGKGVVVATGMKTEFGKIAETLSQVEIEKTPLERRMNEIGRKMGVIAIILVATIIGIEIIESFYLHGALTLDFFLEALLFSMALAVATVPEALPAIVTANLAIGMRTMAKQNALVRRMHAVETLGCTQIICTDKTGTLTKGEMTIRQIYCGKKRFDITGVGYESSGEVTCQGKTPESDDMQILQRLSRVAVLCNDARMECDENGKRIVKGDTTEGALLVLAEKIEPSFKNSRSSARRIGEIPFSSERKIMTTIHENPDKTRIALTKGAPEVVLARCSRALYSDSIIVISENERSNVLSISEEMASNGMRVLALAERPLHSTDNLSDENAIERDFVFLGLVGMMDPPRRDALEAIEVAKGIGMKTIMITGDHKLTAMAVAREMGIYADGDMVLTGNELDQLTDEQYEAMVDKITVYARVSPLHKLKIVTAWKKRDRVVAMTGDGVNDAPALKRSDIGIAMGLTGTEVAKEASHIVLADDNFATIVKAIEYGRLIYGNIKKCLAYLLQANLVEIAVLTFGALFILPFMGYSGEAAFPLLAVQILYINLATDGFPALALSFSPGDPDLMKLPPRARNELVFTREVKLFLVRALIIETPILLAGFILALPAGIESARSRLFLMLVAVELAVALSCRSLRYTIIKVKPHKLLLLTILWECILILAILHVPILRDALHITYPSIEDIVWIFGGAIVTLLSMESLKSVLLRSERRRNALKASND